MNWKSHAVFFLKIFSFSGLFKSEARWLRSLYQSLLSLSHFCTASLTRSNGWVLQVTQKLKGQFVVLFEDPHSTFEMLHPDSEEDSEHSYHSQCVRQSADGGSIFG